MQFNTSGIQRENCVGPDQHVMDISNGNSSLSSQGDMPQEGAMLLLTWKGESRAERHAKEVSSEAGGTAPKNVLT